MTDPVAITNTPIPSPTDVETPQELGGPWKVAYAAANRYVGVAKRQFPHATPRQLVHVLDQRYLMGMGLGAGLTGALSSLPRNAITSLCLSGAHVGMWTSLTTLHLLSLAHVYELAPEETKRLVTSCWGGINHGGILTQQFSRSWWPSTLAYLPVSQVRSVQEVTHNQLKKLARKRGVMGLSKALPPGLGVGLGFSSGRILGHRVLAAARQFLGDPPAGSSNTY